MALSRSFLKGMGLTEEQVGAIVEAHSETVNGLTEQVKSLKAEVSKLQDDAESSKETSDSEWKAKYEEEHSNFEAFKVEQTKNAEHNAKRSAYADVLRKVGVSDKRISQILAVAKVDELKLDKDGNVDGIDNLEKNIKEEWSEFIPHTTTKGADVSTPPASNGKTMTREQIMAIQDRDARRQAIKENPQAFGFK